MSETQSAPAGFQYDSKGNLIPIHPTDRMFLQMAPGSTLTGATLPSGAVVPSEDTWVSDGKALQRKKIIAVAAEE